jgi:WD40 repeat protein
MQILKPGGKNVLHIAFSADGRTIAIPSWKKGLLVWNTASWGKPRILKALGGGYYYGPVQFSADGQFLTYRGGSDTVLGSLTGTDIRPIPIIKAPHAAIIATIVPTTSELIVCEINPISIMHGEVRTRIELRPLADPKPEAAKWSIPTARLVRGCVHLFPARDKIITHEIERYSEWVLVTRDLETGKELQATAPESTTTDYMSFAASGGFLAMTRHRSLKIWRDANLSAPFLILTNDTPKHFTGLAFHPSGRYLAATSNDETVKLYDTTTWEVAKTYTWNIGRMRSIAFSPDGTLAAAGSDTGKVVVWDVDV